MLLRYICRHSVCFLAAKWPEGDFAIPRPVYGCPSPDRHEWTTEKVTFQTDQLLNENTQLLDHPVLGFNNNSHFSLSVCAMHGSRTGEKGRAAWPPGNYCILGVGTQCPSGMISTMKLSRHGVLFIINCANKLCSHYVPIYYMFFQMCIYRYAEWKRDHRGSRSSPYKCNLAVTFPMQRWSS